MCISVDVLVAARSPPDFPRNSWFRCPSGLQLVRDLTLELAELFLHLPASTWSMIAIVTPTIQKFQTSIRAFGLEGLELLDTCSNVSSLLSSAHKAELSSSFGWENHRPTPYVRVDVRQDRFRRHNPLGDVRQIPLHLQGCASSVL